MLQRELSEDKPRLSGIKDDFEKRLGSLSASPRLPRVSVLCPRLSRQEVSTLPLILARPCEACSDQRLQNLRNPYSTACGIRAVKHASDGIRGARRWNTVKRRMRI